MDSRIREVLNEEGENYIFPFLWMHGEEESVIRKYMRVIHEAGVGAVCVESRPHPDFLGDGCGEIWTSFWKKQKNME